MRVEVDGVSLFCEVEGEGDPILFVHGYPLSGYLWDETVRELRADHRCIVPDLRGHGQSEASEQVDMARYADDLGEILAALDEARPVTVVGLSMGGYVAFEFVRRHRERVRSLVLVDTRVGPDAPDAAERRREVAARVLREGSGGVADEMVKLLFAAGADAPLRARWREIMAATPPAGVAAALHAMADRPDSAATLAGFDAPVLIVVGEEDAITPPAEARRMQGLSPDSILKIVPGAGHMTPVERPDEFAAILRDFVDRPRICAGG